MAPLAPALAGLLAAGALAVPVANLENRMNTYWLGPFDIFTADPGYFTVPAGVTIPSGFALPTGFTIPPGIAIPPGFTAPGGISLTKGFTLTAPVVLPTGITLPTGFSLPHGFSIPGLPTPHASSGQATAPVTPHPTIPPMPASSQPGSSHGSSAQGGGAGSGPSVATTVRTVDTHTSLGTVTMPPHTSSPVSTGQGGASVQPILVTTTSQIAPGKTTTIVATSFKPVTSSAPANSVAPVQSTSANAPSSKASSSAPNPSTFRPSTVVPTGGPIPSTSLTVVQGTTSAIVVGPVPKTTVTPSVKTASTIVTTKAITTNGITTTTAVTSTVAATPTAVTNFAGKRGLAYNDASLADPFIGSGTVGWAYNWYSSSGGLSPQIEFVPMMWGTGSDIGLVKQTVNTHKSPYLLTYNEPDETTNYGGSQTSPSDAANAWKSQILPLAGSVQIGSPAVTSYNTTTGGPLGASGLSWLNQFVQDVGGPGASQISFVTLHWYGYNGGTGAQQAAVFQQYIQRASAYIDQMFGRSGMPIWVTEFSPLPIGDQQISQDFLNAALPFLDSYGPVHRYAYFMDSAGNLVNNATSLTSSGQKYIA